MGTVSRVDLEIDETTRGTRQFTCPCCSTPNERTWAFVDRDGVRHAVYFASCYHHQGVHETWIDVVLGTWASPDCDDHVTFGCRVGPVADSPHPAATLVRGGAVAPDEPIFGRKLDRGEASVHSLIGEFWALVDLVLERDHLVREHVYGPSGGSTR